MSAFNPDGDLSGDVAFRLVAASFVRLFWRHALLDQAIDRLLDHGYQVVRLDASAWTREADLHTAHQCDHTTAPARSVAICPFRSRRPQGLVHAESIQIRYRIVISTCPSRGALGPKTWTPRL